MRIFGMYRRELGRTPRDYEKENYKLYKKFMSRKKAKKQAKEDRRNVESYY